MSKPLKLMRLTQHLYFTNPVHALKSKLKQAQLDLLSPVLEQHHMLQPGEIRKGPASWAQHLETCAVALEQYSTATSMEDYARIKNELGNVTPKNLVALIVEIKKRIHKTVDEYRESCIDPQTAIVVQPTFEMTKTALIHWQACMERLKALNHKENPGPAPNTPSVE